jgi:hypothetical protein
MTVSNRIALNDLCGVRFHRTLRVPDDGGDYPLPPSLGAMAIYRLSDDEFVVPMHKAEAVWLEFDGPSWKPHALKLGTGSVDAISGETFDESALTAEPQDYVVIPDQPWLDGINAGEGFIRQFVAVPLGERLTVEAQLADDEEGGLRFSLFAPKPGRFPDEPPRFDARDESVLMACAPPMGLGAGGRIRQEIYADEYGAGTWEPEPTGTVRVELVDALAFQALTGIPIPAPPIDAETYTRFGFPWFDLLSPTRRDVAAAKRLASVRSVADLQGCHDTPLAISEAQVVRLLGLRSLIA